MEISRFARAMYVLQSIKYSFLQFSVHFASTLLKLNPDNFSVLI